jgi:hypothetical protein
MKNKTKYCTSEIKTTCLKTGILLLFALTFLTTRAQQKFELTVNGNSGIYFAEKTVSFYNIPNGLQLGVGSQLYYFLNQKTKIGLGVNYNYIKLSENQFYSPAPIWPDLNVLELPFIFQRDILKNWFVTAGTSVFWHTGSTKPGYWQTGSIKSLDGALGKWEIGTGFRINKLAISLNYSQKFKNHDIWIKESGGLLPGIEDPRNYGVSEYKRRILTLKLEYPLWKF